jgi:tetratricopeptide (TPR) repeat protein
MPFPRFLAAMLWVVAASAQPDALRDAVAALGRADYAAAEKALRQVLGARPDDAAALGLLGVVLDNQDRHDEAGKCYQRALALSPRSAGLLNNYGNHLLATRQPAAARAAFLKVVAVNPAHPNANAQLARLALDDKKGPAALRYLDRVPAAERRSPEIMLLRLRADYLIGKTAEAETILDSLSEAAHNDSRLSFGIGLALAAAGQYGKAEAFLSQALELGPANFDVLYNLGLAALHAGHHQRAHDVLRASLQHRPDDADALYNLGVIAIALKQNDVALAWLARAARQAPGRSEIQRLLAQTTCELGYYPDSALAWNRYLELAPKDDTARRERGFTTALAGNSPKGLAELDWYLARHPNDALGHYEAAVARTASDPDAAFEHLNKAIQLQPDFTAARYARGVVLYRQNELEAALADFLFAAERDAENPVFLDQLGHTYVALDRAAEAVPVLRKAAELNPKDARTLMHFSRALSAVGRTEEARQVIARFRALGRDPAKAMPAAGFVELLALPFEQQYERYRARVEKVVETNPADVPAKLRYLRLLLDDRAWAKAESMAREIAALKPAPPLLAEAGRALLEAERYAAAKELLLQCPQAPGAALDLAIAVFYADGPEAGLQFMERIPEDQRSGDYHLARAQMLDRSGRFRDAVASVEQALRSAPTRADLYCQAALLLIKNSRLPAALSLMEQAARNVPDNPAILLTQAIALEVATKSVEAEKLLTEIERRWPEWPNVHLVHGIILQTHRSYEDALRKLTTAMALGSRESAGYYHLAAATLQVRPDEIEAAQKAIREAQALDPADPWIQALAGRISFERGEYENALKELREAVRLRPHMVQAHYNLARVYKVLGRSEEARREVEQVRLLRKQFPNEGDDPGLLQSSVFGVAPPRR